MERTILHSDLNNFYASVECLFHPELKGKPIAVAGDVEMRHGIVLAKNNEAKRCGVKTAEALWQAKQKCPEIVFVPPNYDLYEKYSQMAREIYFGYTDLIEPFGLDECWLDVSGSLSLFGSGREIADAIRRKVKRELGLTVSVGVSFNKVFAKLGSDMKKPDATTEITPSNFRERVWRLPADEMLFVGKQTYSKLKRYGIYTIGDLAQADVGLLKCLFGKNGVLLSDYANGRDFSPVARFDAIAPPKSIGNSTTPPRDLVSEEDINIILYRLCESVSSRMRKGGFVCRTVQIYVRFSDLSTCERQIKLEYPNRTAQALFDAANYLLVRHSITKSPIRSLGIRALDLLCQESEQLSFSPDIMKIQRNEAVERTVDVLREKYGNPSIKRGIMLTDTDLSTLTLGSAGISLVDGSY